MDYQNTVRKEVCVSGITLHTGVRANLRILPAAENTGIVFRRIDMPGKPEVQAVAGNVIDVRRATTIASRTTGGFVVTVEHIMASLHAAQVDNAVVEMDGPEPPIADGIREGILLRDPGSGTGTAVRAGAGTGRRARRSGLTRGTVTFIWNRRTGLKLSAGWSTE